MKFKVAIRENSGCLFDFFSESQRFEVSPCCCIRSVVTVVHVKHEHAASRP